MVAPGQWYELLPEASPPVDPYGTPYFYPHLSHKSWWKPAAETAAKHLCGITLRQYGVEYVSCRFCGPNHLLEAHMQSPKHLKNLWRLLEEEAMKDPFRPATCGRNDCFVCITGGKGSCQSESVNYDIDCKDCACPCYRGETAINAYTRGKQHMKDFEKKRPKSVMLRHSTEKHNGHTPEFQLNVTGVFRNDAMLRQITEAVKIRTTSSAKLANSRDEWNYLHLPSVTMEAE